MAGVGSSLKAPKNKGEGDGSKTFQDACDADKVQGICSLFFMLLDDQKILSGKD